MTLPTIDTGVFEVLATNGDTHLGGEDFDQRTMKYFMKLFSSGMVESGETTDGETVVSMPDAQPNAFKTLIGYIVTDEVSFEG